MSAPALSLLLEHTADALAAVRAGRSLTEVLARCPAALRGGTQALAFQVLRQLGGAEGVRRLLAPKAPPPPVDALLTCALALLWPQPAPPYAEHTLVDQAVTAARQRMPAAAGFVNAVLRRFLRETDVQVTQALRDERAQHNHPAWWAHRLDVDWPDHAAELLAAAQERPPMMLRVNRRRTSVQAYLERLGLTEAHSFKDLLIRRLFSGNV